MTTVILEWLLGKFPLRFPSCTTSSFNAIFFLFFFFFVGNSDQDLPPLPDAEPPSCQLFLLLSFLPCFIFVLFFNADARFLSFAVTLGDEIIQFTPSKVPEKEKPRRTAVQRKRRLVIDERLELPTAIIRGQIQDFSDLVREVGVPLSLDF